MQKDYSKYQEYSNSLSPSEFVEAVEKLRLTNERQYSKQVVDWRRLLKDEFLVQLDALRPQWRTKNIQSLLRDVDNKPSMRITPIHSDLGPDVVFNDYATQESGYGVIELNFMMDFHSKPSKEELDRYILTKGAEFGYPRIAINPNNEISDDNKQSYYKINTKNSLPEKRRFLLDMLVERNVLQLRENDAVTINPTTLQQIIGKTIDFPNRQDSQDVISAFLKTQLETHPKFQLEFDGKMKRAGKIESDTYGIAEVNFHNELLARSLAESLVKFGHLQCYADYHQIESPRWAVQAERMTHKDNVTQEKTTEVRLENLFDSNASRMVMPFHKDEKPSLLVNFTQGSAQYTTKKGKTETTNLARAEANTKGIAPRTVLTVSNKEAVRLQAEGVHTALLCNQYVQPNSIKTHELSSFKQLIDSFQLPSYNQLSSLTDKENKNLTNGFALRQNLAKAMNSTAELHIDVNSIFNLSKQKSAAAVIHHNDSLLASEKLLAVVVGTALSVKPADKNVAFYDSDTQKTMSLTDFAYQSGKISNPDAFLQTVFRVVEANNILANFIDSKLDEVNERLGRAERKEITLPYPVQMQLRETKFAFNPIGDESRRGNPESLLRTHQQFTQLVGSFAPNALENKAFIGELIRPTVSLSDISTVAKNAIAPVVPPMPKISEHNANIGVFAYNRINETVLEWARKPERLASLQFQQFVQNRGLNQELVDRFSLGFFDVPSKDEGVSNNVFDNAKRLVAVELYKGRSIGEQSLDRNPPELAKVELYDGQNVHNSVSKRIVFPVRDLGGNVIAFGGREIANYTPVNESFDTGSKYYNSAQGWALRDTERTSQDRVNVRNETNKDIQNLWRKKLTFYGLYESMPFIQQQASAVVVEGYMDCIASHKFGVENTVATMGTALDADKLNELYRYTNKAVVMLDGDEPGLNGMIHTLNNALNEKSILENHGTLPLQPHRELNFVHLPFNLDPDEFAHQYGSTALKNEITQAYTLPEFIVRAAYHSVFEIEHKNIGLSSPERVQEKKLDLEHLARFEDEVKKMLSNLATSPSEKVSAEKLAFNETLKQDTITLCQSTKRLLMIESGLNLKGLKPEQVEYGVQQAIQMQLNKGKQQDYHFLQKLVFSDSYQAHKVRLYESMVRKAEEQHTAELTQTAEQKFVEQKTATTAANEVTETKSFGLTR